MQVLRTPPSLTPQVLVCALPHLTAPAVPPLPEPGPAMEGLRSKLATLKEALTDPSRTGLSFANETDVPLLVVLSQLTPCHWARVDPGCTVHLPSGRVWFTISAVFLDQNTVIPTRAGVAVRLTLGIAAGLALSPIAAAVVGTVSGLTSVASRKSESRGPMGVAQLVAGVKKEGVLANGRCIAVRSYPIERGEHQLRFVMPAAEDGDGAGGDVYVALPGERPSPSSAMSAPPPSSGPRYSDAPPPHRAEDFGIEQEEGGSVGGARGGPGALPTPQQAADVEHTLL